MRTEHRDQASFCPFALREVSVLAELALGHLRYSLTDVPPQSNSPPGSVLESDHAGVLTTIGRGLRSLLHAWLENTVTAGMKIHGARAPPNRVSKETMKVVVFHRRCCHLPLMLHLSCLLTVPD